MRLHRSRIVADGPGVVPDQVNERTFIHLEVGVALRGAMIEGPIAADLAR
jgi:hypothetical protein